MHYICSLFPQLIYIHSHSSEDLQQWASLKGEVFAVYVKPFSVGRDHGIYRWPNTS